MVNPNEVSQANYHKTDLFISAVYLLDRTQKVTRKILIYFALKYRIEMHNTLYEGHSMDILFVPLFVLQILTYCTDINHCPAKYFVLF